jgi:hypothetical protein
MCSLGYLYLALFMKIKLVMKIKRVRNYQFWPHIHSMISHLCYHEVLKASLLYRSEVFAPGFISSLSGQPPPSFEQRPHRPCSLLPLEGSLLPIWTTTSPLFLSSLFGQPPSPSHWAQMVVFTLWA